MFQYQRHDIRPLTTAHLAQTMSLLVLSNLELEERIEKEISENPALEIIEPRRCPSCNMVLMNPGPCPICSKVSNAVIDEPIVFTTTQDYFSNTSSDSHAQEEDTNIEEVLYKSHEDLATYVFKQIAPDLNEAEAKIAAHILTSLDGDGLLSDVTPFEVSRYFHVPMSAVEAVISKIQKADPVGVGSSSPVEAMLVQLTTLPETNRPPKIAEAIESYMSLLSRQQFAELAKKLGISVKEASAIFSYIGKNLNPFPGRAYWGDIHDATDLPASNAISPDIVISLLNSDPDSPFVVEIIVPIRGSLRINPLFKTSLQNAPASKKEQWKKSLEQANLIVKCIQQRNHTIERLMVYLTKHQRDFIIKGDEFLKPITRAQIAKSLEVHESTISRAVANKTAQLPNGRLVPLKQFFDRSLYIRTFIKKIIGEENKPLTDTQIARILSTQGIHIARRTVAKYRSIEGILPAHLRKNKLAALS